MSCNDGSASTAEEGVYELVDPAILEHGIAIVGMACRTPGAQNIDQFWQLLREGSHAIRFFSDEELLAAGEKQELLQNPRYVRANGVLEGVELFDAAFFGYSPKEAAITDPQHRLFLECAYEALEHAGYDSERYNGLIGVYASTSISSYLITHLLPHQEKLAQTGYFSVLQGNDKDYLTTRVSYKLNLRGPSYLIQSACSSSLVAVHVASQALLDHECDIALAGGISIQVPQEQGYLYQEEGVLSADGYCRAFDAKATGTVKGNGVGVVVLKRASDALQDGDIIHAIIRGSAVNNDGAFKVGFTAPSVEGQAAVIASALAVAEVDADTVTYMETHGTGTAIGDPIEIEALNRVYREYSEEKGICAIGSVKSNIGHLDTASGIIGLLKVVLSLKHRQIPPSLHFEHPNPQIDFENSPFYVNTSLADWKSPKAPRRAGVSSFGIGGTNAHILLEEAPPVALQRSSLPYHLLVFSARTATALEKTTEQFIAWCQQPQELPIADMAYTLQVGRREFSYRRVLVASDPLDAAQALAKREPSRVLTMYQDGRKRPIAFLYPGSGSQYLHMGADLYRTLPVFRDAMNQCVDILKPLSGIDFLSIVYPSPEQQASQLQQTLYSLPALFMVEYALTQTWLSWGIAPSALIGHSLGEYVAACVSGVFSLEEALRLVWLRAQLLDRLPGGEMLSVSLSAEEVAEFLDMHVSLAAINGPSSCVLSGTREAIAQLVALLDEEEVDYLRIPVDVAGHSPHVEEILDAFRDGVKQCELHAPQVPFISNVTGTWITEEEATDPEYWVRHLRHTVQFSAGIRELLKDPFLLLLEVGPGNTLSIHAKLQAAPERFAAIIPSMRHGLEKQTDVYMLLQALGKLWLAGAAIDLAQVYHPEKRRRVPLPTYPFERQRYWIDPPERGFSPALASQQSNEVQEYAAPLTTYERPALTSLYKPPSNEIEQNICDIWQHLLEVKQIGIHDNFFELGGNSLLATQVVTRLRELFSVELPLRSVFETLTIAKLAELVEEKMIESLESLPEDDLSEETIQGLFS